MRVVSHTCSNTEIVCALGCADRLVAVDSDSDHPADALAGVPRLGRDLELDVGAVAALAPDLVLTSLTVPGHERIVAALRERRLKTLVVDPRSLNDVFLSIKRIAARLGVPERGLALIREMRLAMPPVEPTGPRPRILVEWWPKPVIAPGAQSWVTDLLELAGARNPWADAPAKSLEIDAQAAREAAPDAIVMAWCGVREDKYRADVVLRRVGWDAVPAVSAGQVHPISEAYLGRPGPRLVEGYRRIRAIVERLGGGALH